MLLIDKLLLQIAILAEICIKMRYLLKKLQKSPSARGLAPQTLLPPATGGFGLRPPTSGGWGLCPQTPPPLLPLKILGYATGVNAC